MMSLFDCIEEAPMDPILGMNELFNADPHPDKINLTIGVYLTEMGHIPLMNAVKMAEKIISQSPKPHPYQPIQGSAFYTAAVQSLVFGQDSVASKKGHIVTVQALGGTGGLSLGADFLKIFFPKASVAISDPSWENHYNLFSAAGFPVVYYPYYDAHTHGLNFSGMLESLQALPKQSIVVLHACCHNPTGIDLTLDQWAQVVDICQAQALIPFIDMAYQGFGQGLDQDAAAVRMFTDAGMSLLVSNSFSKSFSLYGERVGALSIVTQSPVEAARVLSQIKRVIRTNYSNPPTYGSVLVTHILTQPELRKLWDDELSDMRHRIQTMRHELVEKLNPRSKKIDFSFINQQQGMFSYSGLTANQVSLLKTRDSLYILSTGRLCIAALNNRNIDRVVDAIARVLD